MCILSYCINVVGVSLFFFFANSFVYEAVSPLSRLLYNVVHY